MEDFDEQDMENNKNFSNLRIPKCLIFASKNNSESYVFKKNAENYKTFFNFSIIVFAVVVVFTQITKFITAKEFSILMIVSIVAAVILIIMTLILLYLHFYFTKKSPYKT
jgi:uncharacterized Tic20 family protein